MSTTLREVDLQLIDTALRAWPNIPPTPPDASTPAHRLINAARSAAQNPTGTGAPDLAVLLRHVLRAEAELSGSEKGLTTPREPPWPGPADWPRFGMSATSDGATQTVFASPWAPEWLSPNGSDPAAAAFRGSHREDIGDVPHPRADPFLTAIAGRDRYRSTGQREAVRAIVATPPAATIIGNLPTGSGKSLAAYIPALLSDRPGTTLVVVPTTSLALDQERAFNALVADRNHNRRFPTELAYHSQLSDADRSEIRRRIADGSQSIVFTSPESLVQSLSSAAYTAAERGLIAGFVIDEAHIVSQWGTSFRPAFQALAGMRGDLLRVSAEADRSFRTILLSATLTEESLSALQGLFGRPGPTELMSSLSLRHEPSYWLASRDDEQDRDERIEECLRHLPRPLVLYTTLVSDAKTWYHRLKEAGHRRLMFVAGETDAAGRSEAISRLRDASLDLVVATSAFGLGVDQPDLRAVVHATVPETLDRYYQEVGRGGRDGRPSVAMLIATPRDRAIANRNSQRKLISLERGFERWQAMHLAAEPQQDGRLRLPLAESPPDLEGDSAENRAWNMRTLLLMDRGELLTLEAAPPPKRTPEETDDDWEARAPAAFEEYASYAIVEPKVGTLADRQTWERCVGDARRDAVQADRTSRGRMDRALEPNSALCDLFAEAYRIRRALPGIPEGQIPVPVAASCGGCPGCRCKGLAPRRYVPPEPAPARSTAHAWSPSLRARFAGQTALVTLYPPSDAWVNIVTRSLERLARHGMWCLQAPPHILESSVITDLHRIAPGRAIFHLERWDQLHAALLPTALVFSPDATIPAEVLEEGGPDRVVFVPDDAIDPRHGTARIADYHSAVTDTQDLIEAM